MEHPRLLTVTLPEGFLAAARKSRFILFLTEIAEKMNSLGLKSRHKLPSQGSVVSSHFLNCPI